MFPAGSHAFLIWKNELERERPACPEWATALSRKKDDSHLVVISTPSRPASPIETSQWRLDPSRRRFTSYDRSGSTGLDYAINRHYSSAQGRFTQVDPIGMSAVSLGDPQSLNLYAYCGNDPVNRLDPDGLFWGKLFGWIGKVVRQMGRHPLSRSPSPF
ncbi:MAG: RHS repeat-associated core domain-containing protein [Acidobacteria bacterium]|nr:RHS repeat-associated core domain-containing protein [Acidobacteriota bacterium]